MGNNKLLISGLGIILLFCFIKLSFWKHNFVEGDSWGYYSYLPATLLYQDLGSYDRTVSATKKYKADFADPLNDIYGTYHKNKKTGKIMVKYTSGVAIMLAPFFLLAHVYASISGGSADGFSAIYAIGAGIGVIFWVCFGAYFLLLLLQRYFSRNAALLTTLTLTLGTNLYYNTVYNSIMSHALLFSLYGQLLYFTDTYYRNPSRRLGLLTGLIFGAIALIRLNEIYAILIPLLWGVTDKKSLSSRLQHIKSNYAHYLSAGLPVLLLFIPQLLYWKSFSGDWLYNGYIGEKFNFAKPHIFQGLLSYNNGWLVWTPIMFLTLPGMFLLKRYTKAPLWPIAILLPLHIYIIYSWWCWNYINGFGSRPMEHMYPLLAFPLAAFLEWAWTWRPGRIAAAVLLLGAIALNMFQVYQIESGILITQESNRAYYWSVLGQTKSSPQIMTARTSNEIQPDNPVYVAELHTDNFEDSTQYKGACPDPVYQGKFSRRFSDQLLFLHKIPMEKLEKGRYLRISGFCYFKPDVPSFQNVWDTPFLFIQWQDEQDKNIRKYDSGINPFQFAGNPRHSIYSTGSPNIWAHFQYFVHIPHDKAHHAALGIWNGKNSPFYLDDLRVELYK